MTYSPPIELKDADEAPEAMVEKALADLSTTVDQRIKAVEEKADTSALTERLDTLEAKMNRPHAQAKSDDGRETTKAINAFLRYEETDEQRKMLGLNGSNQKALNIGTANEGAELVAPEYSRRIVEGINEMSPLRSLSTVMSVGGTTVYMPTLTGRLSGTWVAETGTRQASEPTFGQIQIDNHEHAVIVPISRQLLEDSMIDLAGYLQGQIAQQFAKSEATAHISGDGNGKPLGLLDTTLIAGYQSTEAAVDGSDIIAKCIEAFYALPAPYARNATWLMNRATMGVIRNAADTTTKGTLWSDSLADGTPARFLGVPVVPAPDMDDLALDGIPIALGDFRAAYTITDRVGLQIMRDDYTGADTGVVKLRARRRSGAKPVLQEAVHLIKAPAS